MPTKGVPLNESRTHRERRLSMGDVLGLRKPHGQTRTLKHFAPGGLCAPDSTFEKHNGPGPDAQKEFEQARGQLRAVVDDMHDERPNVMSFGEQFVELLGEFVDAREQYAHSRRGVGGEYANSDDMNKAGNALQALLDKRFP